MAQMIGTHSTGIAEELPRSHKKPGSPNPPAGYFSLKLARHQLKRIQDGSEIMQIDEHHNQERVSCSCITVQMLISSHNLHQNYSISSYHSA